MGPQLVSNFIKTFAIELQNSEECKLDLFVISPDNSKFSKLNVTDKDKLTEYALQHRIIPMIFLGNQVFMYVHPQQQNHVAKIQGAAAGVGLEGKTFTVETMTEEQAKEVLALSEAFVEEEDVEVAKKEKNGDYKETARSKTAPQRLRTAESTNLDSIDLIHGKFQSAKTLVALFVQTKLAEIIKRFIERREEQRAQEKETAKADRIRTDLQKDVLKEEFLKGVKRSESVKNDERRAQIIKNGS